MLGATVDNLTGKRDVRPAFSTYSLRRDDRDFVVFCSQAGRRRGLCQSLLWGAVTGDLAVSRNKQGNPKAAPWMRPLPSRWGRRGIQGAGVAPSVRENART
jgi:hypothetical protein